MAQSQLTTGALTVVTPHTVAKDALSAKPSAQPAQNARKLAILVTCVKGQQSLPPLLPLLDSLQQCPTQLPLRRAPQARQPPSTSMGSPSYRTSLQGFQTPQNWTTYIALPQRTGGVPQVTISFLILTMILCLMCRAGRIAKGTNARQP